MKREPRAAMRGVYSARPHLEMDVSPVVSEPRVLAAVAPPQNQRARQLDILRAVAVLLVIGRHILPCPSAQSAIVAAATRALSRGGWIGVDLFFVLSGFLIATLLLSEIERHGRIDVPRFLLRRTLRLLPPLWLFIASTVYLGQFANLKFPPFNILAELLFVQNYFFGIWDHTWSLAVEMHFYLLFTIVCAGAGRRLAKMTPRELLLGVALLGLVCLGVRIVAAVGAPFDVRRSLFPSHLRLDAFFGGAFIACLLRRRPDWVHVARTFRGVLVLVGIALLAPAFLWRIEHPFIHTSGLTLNTLGAGCLLVAAAASKAPRGIVVAILALIGRKSYSIYLWHIPFLVFAVPSLLDVLGARANWFSYAAVCVGGSIGLGIIMATVTELPVLLIRDRLLPTRSTVQLDGDAAPPG